MKPIKILIACKIFFDELQHCLPQRDDFKIIWIEAALHANLTRLEEELNKSLSAAAAIGTEIQLFLGIGCHPDIVKLAKKFNARISPVKNCLEAFLGARQKDLEKNDTMILTPGWLRAWPSIMAELGWNEVDVRMNYGRYQRILLLEPGINPLTDEEILSFFDLIQVPIEIEPLELNHFEGLLSNLIG